MAGEGPLNTEVHGDAAACRAVSQWFKDASHGVHDAGTAMNRSRSESESFWEGLAGDSFRSDVRAKAHEADQVVDAAEQFSQGISTFADGLDTARARMRQAREVATRAGLTVTATEILPPGPEPQPSPAQPPGGSDPHSTQRYDENMRSFTAAYDQHKAMTAAFDEASDTVGQGREREQDAHRSLRDALDNEVLVNLKNYGPTAAGAAAATGSAVYTAQKKLAEKLGHYAAGFDRAKGVLDEPGTTFAQRSQARTDMLSYRKAMFDTESKIGPKVPKWFGAVTAASAGDAAENSLRFSRMAPALKKVPYLGAALTVVSAGRGISEGKPVAKETEKAVVGTGSSIATGALVGTCVGGPIGAAGGAVLGAAVSYGVGEFIDQKGGPVEQVNRKLGWE